ncbi:hypothetical protein NPIL_574771 [Nephila pilipes]|uniref:Uncharacterized protein n=1 Tax=Nephila pilipes TaxID=299642 RepID=A0A8X6PN32_NEPPI|nr:hypothetical protein NPIL_574771 [Nephila pilipes]
MFGQVIVAIICEIQRNYFYIKWLREKFALFFLIRIIQRKFKNYCLVDPDMKTLITKNWKHKPKRKERKNMINKHLKTQRNVEKILVLSKTIPIQILIDVVMKDMNNMMFLGNKKIR